jgi:hypothetical protein
MLTDAPPRKKNRQFFLASDRLKSIDLPADGRLLGISQAIESAMESGSMGDVRRHSAEFVATVSDFYRVPKSDVQILAARPLRTRRGWRTELFGDYHPTLMLIRVWMKTAVRREITSFGTFLSTLCHEFCHHLDFQQFKFRDSWHTRGFYERAAILYHHARGTPVTQLVWMPAAGQRWRIDWGRTNRAVLQVAPPQASFSQPERTA